MSVAQIAQAAAQQLKADRPAEIGFAPSVEVVIRELYEGNECSEFFRGECRSALDIKRGDSIILLCIHYSTVQYIYRYGCDGSGCLHSTVHYEVHHFG